MAIKIYKPTTPARRKTSIVSFSDITKSKPEKKLTVTRKTFAGRNKSGKITVRHRGGGAKRRIRLVDFKRLKFNQPASVAAIEYDPNRSARIALVQYEDGQLSYILAADGIKVGDKIVSSDEKVAIKVGNRMPLEFIPAGINVYNVELNPGQGGVMARSAGSSAVVQAIEGKFVQLKMPSGEIRLVKKECLATIGQVSNPDHRLVRLGKAGRQRHRGIRPSVRGKAMNPCDHPHGGGEGRHPIGMRYPKTKWGKHAMGVKTRNNKRWSNRMIIQRSRKESN
ncbi:50S ribosomal protein L2 [Candidatus Kuenenbacteria bacterium CG_4_9_14_3_um_filter_39_14]|uniref:Large ribosomal subunit protein uL2 n=7 Tax=Candidatus Kueneniibacteriota TaxID=1752740 RepID=A0A2M7IMC0_9BACT|nr:50S ribosomal protein L2 [Candidatus Kuenenbacteria bacterium]OIP56771.1 MAG: 50S ribosomal protein L2 [Candidatus Kuenenbacteria bacterium CG2_30_39_24]PIP28933.1 MAG: 50S ribosomal protein L2 [Candidatus Kuenenbacteria bacterium CG23_combo_of_CG06-09_8_20_14_all_39_39]PIP75295.1 MAG: 50S ribosomal protein L2 [Candidatus Kuenenbacteria bacterium CG22_combo_CG10-13_8_21_14_all_39_9]PIR81081.1 MAG: 50S ribosomal protein L2 [Candidatus Kuenenbacteria bacterium CG10_big_fil_rev_8_21_14_0_10_39_